MLHSICQQIWKTQQWPQDWQCQFSFQSQRKAMSKNVQAPTQLHSSSMLAEKAVAPHSSTLAWKIPWMEEPGGLQSMGSLRVGHDWVTSLSLSLACIGEGNGSLLQCSCLENPRDRGAWWASVYGIAQSWTRLKQLSSSSSNMNREFPDVQAGFRKGRETKLPTSVGSQKKQENSRKTSTSASLTMLKPLTVWITTNFGKYLKRSEYQTAWPASWETCMQAKKQQFELDMLQQTGSTVGKE